MNLKVCTKCGEEKDESQFYFYPKRKTRRSQCKSCHKLGYRTCYKRDPEKYRNYVRNHPNKEVWRRRRNLKTFGLTLEDYDNMLEKQEYKCKICGTSDCESGKRLAVDHCHESGKVRGLLCRRCNQSMGKFNDDPNLIRKVLEYLLENGS